MTTKHTIQKGKLKTVEVLTLQDISLPAKIYCAVSDGSKFVTVHHLDGMYSFGLTEKGHNAHLYRFTPLKKYGKSYKVK